MKLFSPLEGTPEVIPVFPRLGTLVCPGHLAGWACGGRRPRTGAPAHTNSGPPPCCLQWRFYESGLPWTIVCSPEYGSGDCFPWGSASGGHCRAGRV